MTETLSTLAAYQEGAEDALFMVKKVLERHHHRISRSTCAPLCGACMITEDILRVDSEDLQRFRREREAK